MFFHENGNLPDSRWPHGHMYLRLHSPVVVTWNANLRAPSRMFLELAAYECGSVYETRWTDVAVAYVCVLAAAAVRMR